MWRFRQRFGPGRRCFALVHPAAADDPVAVLHVALTGRPAASMGDVNSAGSGSLLPRPIAAAHAATGVAGREAAAGPARGDAADAVANFWSVSLCAPGLRGLSTARHLIYGAVEELSGRGREPAAAGRFVTLSPVPGFARWAAELGQPGADEARRGASAALDDGSCRALWAVRAEAADAALDAAAGVPEARSVAHSALRSAAEPEPAGAEGSLVVLLALLVRWQHAAARGGTASLPAIMSAGAAAAAEAGALRLCRWYLASGGVPRCPVANFHCGNGAVLWRVNWAANVTPKGLVESFGVMVNYLYAPGRLEDRAAAFAAVARDEPLPVADPGEVP